MILYTLVRGVLPFNVADSSQLENKIVFEPADLDKLPAWVTAKGTVSPCLDLIRQMLAKDEGDRPSIERVLDHSWFTPCQQQK